MGRARPGDVARVLDYLARYLFRVAISNIRIEQIDDRQITFRYRAIARRRSYTITVQLPGSGS